MNERFKELAEQAKVECGQWLRIKSATTITYDELEKFAELIVKECMDQVRDEVQYITDYDKADQVVNVVRNHFGVEEKNTVAL